MAASRYAIRKESGANFNAGIYNRHTKLIRRDISIAGEEGEGDA